MCWILLCSVIRPNAICNFLFMRYLNLYSFAFFLVLHVAMFFWNLFAFWDCDVVAFIVRHFFAIFFGDVATFLVLHFFGNINILTGFLKTKSYKMNDSLLNRYVHTQCAGRNLNLQFSNIHKVHIFFSGIYVKITWWNQISPL